MYRFNPLKACLWLLLLCGMSLSLQAQNVRHRFALADSVFLLDGKPFQIISGELHYERIPEAYWKDRLLKAKAMGLNTVAVYCFWNMHEPEPGRFDFKGNQDVARFVRLAQQAGLWVILRPGPYVCAEWEFGGYPWWLLKDPHMTVRSSYPPFMKAARKYLDALGRELAPLQVTHGGPILMVQVENEYGSFGKDTSYERDIAHMLRGAGFDVPLFTADGDWLFKNAALPGVLPGANGETSVTRLRQQVNAFHSGVGPYFIPEYYPGWLDHWGEPFVRVAAKDFLHNVDTLLGCGVSISFYMFHGGTNFGFMNGANYTRQHPIQPDITSYDYDAPLSESGQLTDKYWALRRVIEKHLLPGTVLPKPPAPTPQIRIPAVSWQGEAPLESLLGRPVHSQSPLSMEALNQGYGWVLYRTSLPVRYPSLLHIDSLRDYALVYVDGRFQGSLDRRLNQDSLKLQNLSGKRMDILVENMGRINYGPELLDNHKGILGAVRLGSRILEHWACYSLPMTHPQTFTFRHPVRSATAPVLLNGSFRLETPGDTYLDMSRWGKGQVWVNGHNLGRYWCIGPQQTLYLPGCWLHKGLNRIEVFEELKAPHDLKLQGLDHPILDQLHMNR